MGIFDVFKRRRERESAMPQSEALGSFARDEGQPVIGQQVGGGDPATSIDLQGFGLTDGLAMLSQLGPMIQKAIAEGNVTIEQGPSQTIDLRGTGIREEIFEIMKQHGIDPEAGTAAKSVDASDYGDMQQQILAALAKHGVDPGASGTSVDLQIKRDDD